MLYVGLNRFVFPIYSSCFQSVLLHMFRIYNFCFQSNPYVSNLFCCFQSTYQALYVSNLKLVFPMNLFCFQCFLIFPIDFNVFNRQCFPFTRKRYAVKFQGEFDWSNLVVSCSYDKFIRKWYPKKRYF